MCELVIAKECEMNAKKPKYHEILHNSKILHTQAEADPVIRLCLIFNNFCPPLPLSK